MHTLKSSVIVVARMLLVTSFVVAMPCWAVFWAYEQSAGNCRQALAKTPLPAEVPTAWAPPFDRSFVGPAACEPAHVAATPVAAAGQNPARERILSIETRLQALGAAYLRLTCRPDPAPIDPLPTPRHRYYFLCQMPLPGHTPYCKPFEAVADDPEAAMRIVLDQVERWLQAGGRE
jgi:hypothetical protein